MKTVFMYQGQAYETLKEIAVLLGRKTLARRDMGRAGVTEVTVDETANAPTPEAPKATEPEQAPDAPDKADNEPETEPTPEVKPEPEQENPEEESKAEDSEEPNGGEESDEQAEDDGKPDQDAPKGKGKPVTQAQLDKAAALQQKTGYSEITKLAEDLKKMKPEEVIGMATELGLTWKEDDHSGINRMRAAMAIRAAIFPGQRRPRPPKSVWRDFETEELEKLARKHKVNWRETIDEKINRMWLIDALKKANVSPPQKEPQK